MSPQNSNISSVREKIDKINHKIFKDGSLIEAAANLQIISFWVPNIDKDNATPEKLVISSEIPDWNFPHVRINKNLQGKGLLDALGYDESERYVIPRGDRAVVVDVFRVIREVEFHEEYITQSVGTALGISPDIFKKTQTISHHMTILYDGKIISQIDLDKWKLVSNSPQSS